MATDGLPAAVNAGHHHEIPDIVIGRLPVYLRTLKLLAAEGHEVASSQELGERLGISSAQIRKDLSHFGDFGKQGTGYQISYLIEQLRQILQVNREWGVIIVGAGHVGQALANYRDFPDHGFKIVAIFDSDPAKIGMKISDLVIQDVNDVPVVLREHHIKIAMLATPAEAAQEIVNMLVGYGVQSILNYAPINLSVPDGVQVQYIDPVGKLQHMTYYIREDK
jgi:redox-sensing transcriptional repressor